MTACTKGRKEFYMVVGIDLEHHFRGGGRCGDASAALRQAHEAERPDTPWMEEAKQEQIGLTVRMVARSKALKPEQRQTMRRYVQATEPPSPAKALAESLLAAPGLQRCRASWGLCVSRRGGSSTEAPCP